MTIALRPYQARAKDAVRARIAAGVRRILVVAPTGSGKTVLFSSVVESGLERRSHGLILAHRRELIKQPFCRFIRAGLDPAQVGVVLAGVPASTPRPLPEGADDDTLWAYLARRRPDALVQVASIDSIRHRTKPPANYVIIDEAHRTLSKGYLTLAEEYPAAVIIGLTATPLRADNKPLGQFFQEMIIVSTYMELVAEGYLVEPTVFTVPEANLPDLTQVRIKGGDFDVEQLTQACDRATLVGDIVSHWTRRGNNAPTVCFAVSVEHSKHIVERFVAAGISAKHVDANTPTTEREGALRDLRSGALRVLVNVDVLTEGVDVTAVKTVVLARPTTSLRIYLQQVGRGSRPDPSGLPFTVLDHAGMVGRHGLPHMIEFDPAILHNTKDRAVGVKGAPARTCPACLACMPVSFKVCPDCSHEFATEARTPIEEEDGELVQVTAPTPDQLRASWTAVSAECIEKGYKPGWCYSKWTELYPGIRPPAGCVPPSLEDTEKVRNEHAEILDEYLATVIERGYKVGWAKSSFKTRCGTWPSLDLFRKTRTSEVALAVGVALSMAARMRRTHEPARVSVVQPAPAANDVDLVDYAV